MYEYRAELYVTENQAWFLDTDGGGNTYLLAPRMVVKQSRGFYMRDFESHYVMVVLVVTIFPNKRYTFSFFVTKTQLLLL